MLETKNKHKQFVLLFIHIRAQIRNLFVMPFDDVKKVMVHR